MNSNVQADWTPPPGFSLMEQQDTFIDHIGPVWICMHNGMATTLLQVQKRHTNPNGTVHGGVLMTLMDITLGSSVEGAMLHEGGEVRGHPITMQISCNMVGAAALGEVLRVDATVDRMTNSMGFASGRITADERLLMTASALFKRPTRSRRTAPADPAQAPAPADVA